MFGRSQVVSRWSRPIRAGPRRLPLFFRFVAALQPKVDDEGVVDIASLERGDCRNDPFSDEFEGTDAGDVCDAAVRY